MQRELLSQHDKNYRLHRQEVRRPRSERQYDSRKKGCTKTFAFIGLIELIYSTPSLVVNSFHVVTTTDYYLHPHCRRIGQQPQHQPNESSKIRSYMFPPPGSGYASNSDDYKEIYKSEMPETYEPMMAFPGTMRPGKTPENMPFQDLPIGDDDPDPVPWPHFQQIEWHHRWSQPPHEHPGTMEDFIESLGRWATPQQEAAMRAGVRREMRQRQEVADNERRDTIITDDDEDEFDDEDDDYEDKDEPVALGDGIFGKLGSDADRAATAAAVSPDAAIRTTGDRPISTAVPSGNDEDTDDLFVDDDLDDFLLDLGLDAELDDDVGAVVPENDDKVVIPMATGTMMDDDDDDIGTEEIMDTTAIGDIVGGIGLGVTPAFGIDTDDEFVTVNDNDVDDDDDEMDDGLSTVPLEDFSDGDNLDVEDIFDEGGFDYDDGDYGGGSDGDIW